MIKSLKGGVLFGMLGFACIMATPAHADRVLTEHEASKLTFRALIAPPSAYRHSRKHGSSFQVASARRHTAVTVRNVAFRGRVITRHRSGSHRRRG